MGDNVDELREAMNAAWDESEKEGDEAAQEKLDLEPETTESNDEVSHGANQTDEQNDEKTPENKEKVFDSDEKATDKAPKVEKEGDTAPKATKAPASWSPKARETWGKVPADAQAQIAKREQEINQVMQQSAGARKAAESLNAVLAPHREALQAAGYSDPFQAISTLLQAEAGLRTGNSRDRAQGIINLINHYGVDIAAIDEILTGQVPQNNPNTQLEDMLDERMAPINQFLQQQQQQQQYGEMQQAQDAHTSINEFSADKEFIEDVRLDMASLMDAAANRSEPMDLEKAYTIACQINPEVSQIIQQRQTQQNIMGTNNAAQAKKAAAVSLTGIKGGAGGMDGKLSMRDTIAQAWNESVG